MEIAVEKTSSILRPPRTLMIGANIGNYFAPISQAHLG
jgi:hypothetical protein